MLKKKKKKKVHTRKKKTMAASLIGGYQALFAKVGLGQPIPRALVGAAIFSIPLFLKSDLSYKHLEGGITVPKSWSLFATPEQRELDLATPFPWYVFPVLGALIFGLFL